MLRVPQARATQAISLGEIGIGQYLCRIPHTCFDVLGANGYGYWSEAGGSSPHQNQPNVMGTNDNPLAISPARGY